MKTIRMVVAGSQRSAHAELHACTRPEPADAQTVTVAPMERPRLARDVRTSR
jgi:hypothetical protein